MDWSRDKLEERSLFWSSKIPSPGSVPWCYSTSPPPQSRPPSQQWERQNKKCFSPEGPTGFSACAGAPVRCAPSPGTATPGKQPRHSIRVLRSEDTSTPPGSGLYCSTLPQSPRPYSLQAPEPAPRCFQVAEPAPCCLRAPVPTPCLKLLLPCAPVPKVSDEGVQVEPPHSFVAKLLRVLPSEFPCGSQPSELNLPNMFSMGSTL
ncbi:hypothetical protein AMECASPLE_014331 [Ameca splendens]|uniref:Uncharacterized protein n=1 Tax=Ameca splendens TaxID=208324 RepID=A0ABV0Y1F9_9TELE